MNNFILHNPTKIVFGVGEIEKVGLEARRLGRRAFITTGKTAVHRFGILERVVKTLKTSGIESVVYDQIEPNPRTKSIDEGGKLAKKNQCDFVIGLGGGSSMDASKGIAAMAVLEGSIWNYIKSGPGGHRKITGALPVMTIPTFAGSGSEANSYGVVTHWELRQKAVFAGECLFPKVAVVDPSLTLTVPPASTGEGGIDMLCHLLESYFTGNDSSPVQDRLTEGLVAIVVENLGKVIQNPNDLEARTALSWTSTLALSGFIDAGRAGGFPIHWLEHSLSAHYDIPHGRGLAILLPRVVAYTLEARPGRYAQLAKRVFGPHVVGTGRSNLEAAYIFHQELIKWMAEVKMYSSLREVGIDAALFDRMADDVLYLYGKGQDFLENPRRITKEGILEIFNKSLDVHGS
ncbi:MAG: iron-containing alcohol dehydrogenase [Nitrospirae bacterium]|nr:iron-containing alcohol dehydrogenase [Nitrospirota bacterium]MBI3351594.1 iron-containing alcohol dehydrogenase [Nitrospirota bacterium]